MILVINTSGKGLEFVLDDKYTHIDTEKQSVALPVECERFLRENGATWSDLTAIGVVVGPGSFTGIRLVNAFDLYLVATPDAFVAIDSGRGDFFVSAKNLAPCVMSIDELETRQMDWPRTVGHKPFDLRNALSVVRAKLSAGESGPVVPMYLRPSYAEQNKK